jgi:tetratricopeptide (TPR) repeat protein
MTGHERRKTRRRPDTDKVIRVIFGPGGGRVPDAGTKASGLTDDSDPGAREPVTDLFTRSEVARLLSFTSARLSSLDRAGVVSPSGRRRGRRAYTFTDLIALRAAQALLDEKVRLRDVTRAVDALRKSLPQVTRPLVELRIASDGRKVVVYTEDGPFDPTTGQMVINFDVETLREDVVRVLRPNAGRDRARTAYELYLQASQLDEDPNTMDDAEKLYERVIALDPWLAIAYTNMGNIRFRRHDVDGARDLYQRALEIDPRQPEAQYNLGYVTLERGDPEAAIGLFRGAIESDPKFADAYFNIAMAYEQLGQARQARSYWKHYVDLEPHGAWAEIARRHL